MEQDPQNQKKSVDEAGELVGNVIGGLVLFAIGWYGIKAFSTYETNNMMDKIQNDFAVDAERQYRDAKQYGSAMDKCVQAGLAAMSHLQAGNSSSYGRWKGIEEADCAAAGLR